MTTAGQRHDYRQPAVIYGILAIGLAVALGVLLSWQTRSLIAEKHQYLAAILHLKVQTVEEWLGDNRRDITLTADNLTLRRDAAAFLQSGEVAEKRVLTKHLESLCQGFGSSALLFLNAQGINVAAAGSRSLLGMSPDLTARAIDVARSGVPIFNYIHRVSNVPPSSVYIDYLAPVRAPDDRNRIIGVLVLRSESGRDLFQLLQVWPVASETAETVLVRRRGDRVEYLNDLRFRKDTAMKLERPLSDPVLASVRGLLAGRSVVVDGHDYRGVDVFAAVRPVVGTEWVMESKVDRDEALAPVRHLAWVWSSGILGFMLFTTLGSGTLWRQAKRTAMAREAALESERRAIAERFQILSRFANDVILLIDEKNRVAEANERAFEFYGIPRDRLLGLPVSALRAPATSNGHDRHFNRIMQNGTERYETAHVGAGGVEIPVEISGHRVLAEGQRYVLKIIRDISDCKRAEAQMRDSNERLRTIIERLPFGMIVTKEDGTPADFINAAFKDITGYGEAETDTFDKAMQYMVPDPKWRAAAAADRIELMTEAKRTGQPSQKRLTHLIRRDGALRHVEFQFVDLESVGVWTFNDVTARVEAEKRVKRLLMFKDALSALNRSLVRLQSEEEIWAVAVQVVVRRAGCLGAWIGMADAELQSVRCVAGKGAVVDRYWEMTGGWPEMQAGEDELVQAALDTARTVTCPDFSNDPRSARWHELAKTHGVAACAVVPVLRAEKVMAVMKVYLDEVAGLDEEMIALLEQMADDISFTFGAIRSEMARQTAEQDFRESESRFRAIIEQSISGIYVADENQRFIYVNPRMAEIFGYADNEELVNKPIVDVVAPQSRSLVTEAMQRRLEGKTKSARYDFSGIRKDGTRITVGVHGTAGRYGGRPVVIGTLQDVTEVRRAEDKVQQYVNTLEKTTHSTIEIISTMGELRDPYTQGHERRVGEIAAAIGAEMGLDENSLEGLRVAGHLHDVGKISVPAEILSKPGRLTKIEYQLVQEHAQTGYDILKGYDFPWPIALVTLQHHERLDGSGYPQGLKGGEILFEARILAVADTVEAMSSHRPYRPGLGLARALIEIEGGSGKLYDPEVAAACLRLFREKGYQAQD